MYVCIRCEVGGVGVDLREPELQEKLQVGAPGGVD